MEFWFVVLLSVIAVLAITLLLFLELMGEDSFRLFKIKHKRGEYINDMTAVICQTIKDTVDSRKAYSLFVEYTFTNHKQFLLFLKATLSGISHAYSAHDVEAYRKFIKQIKEMKVELKDQKTTEEDCMKSIETPCYIESAAWIHLAANCRFGVNEGLKRLAEVCLDYSLNYSEPFPQQYLEQLDFLAGDICNICDSIYNLIGSGNIEGMRELRKRMSVILDESYANTQRLYELLHDGRSDIPEEKRIALQYVLNNFQECHCMIYTLRRLVLADLCITISLT